MTGTVPFQLALDLRVAVVTLDLNVVIGPVRFAHLFKNDVALSSGEPFGLNSLETKFSHGERRWGVRAF